MRITLLLLMIIGLPGVVLSQTVRGRVVDAGETLPLPGAYVSLVPSGAEAPARQTTTDASGDFVLTALTPGSYLLTVSFLGYQTAERPLTVADSDLQLPALKLIAGIELGEVEVTESVVPVRQRGDTTEFNADAYKTMPDATAEDLIEKMPTITITDGKVQAQGEDVARVLVDGRPFFGNDPTAALRNLPAEVIQRIEVFDQQSDQAQFTGFDDGETTKTVNIITRPSMRNGEFGSGYAGYGTDDRYSVGGNLNWFDDDRRISVVGLSNNVSKQNFSSEDLLGVTSSASSGGGRRGPGGGGRGGGQRGSGEGGPGGNSAGDFLVSDQAGIVASDAVGINYSNTWSDKLEATGSYFFNRADSYTESDISRQFFDAEGLRETYLEEGITTSVNTNHRFTGKLEYTLDERNSFIYRPRLSWQGNTGTESIFGQTLEGGQLLNDNQSDYTADLTALNFSNNLLWRHRFATRGRTLSVNLSGGISPNEGNSYLTYAGTSAADTLATEQLDQQSLLDTRQWNGGVNIRYTEPLSRSAMLLFSAASGYRREDSETLTYDLDPTSEEYTVLNPTLSNVFVNDYFTQEVGTGINYRKGSLNASASAGLQYASLTGERSYWSVLPTLRLRYRTGNAGNLTAHYRSRTELPSILQLQEVIDNSNPLFLTTGNADLLPATDHNFTARYNLTDPERSSVFFALLGGSYTANAIVNSTTLSEAAGGVQLTRPVNLDNDWTLRALTTYGFPVGALGSNLNVDLSANLRNAPGLIDDQLNNARTTATGLGLTLSSNISERVDFTLSSRSSMNWVRNDLQVSSNNNYLQQKSRARLSWLPGANIVIRTDLTHQLYRGLDESFDQDYLLWNASIGMKVMENDRGEFSLSAFDILGQNTSLTRNVTETYTEDLQTNALQQYFLLSFKYDLRRFD
ncbi:TonB-dependent receptor [Lewinella sp. JB7]|uniref:TonB-dependent receptor n=1 Tax=Lewinella sp. JB7 TaxID=2962887 RepID=UPI0020C93DA4|nr:TonB-dependent receptor [Lewinella sp. JB7]MCP9234565.1 outer membrane beta-barrel protein [Lewinella sp. JB7]